MTRTTTIKVNVLLEEFICPVSLDIPSKPVLASCCGVTFDYDSVKNQKSCPCCRSEKTTFSCASSITKDLLQHISSALSASGQDTNGTLSIDFPLDFISSFITSDDKSRVVQNTIDVVLAQHPNLCERMPFNLDAFEQIVREDKLSTLAGQRFITQLKNNINHLNQTKVIQIITSTAAGRLILRKNLNVKIVYDEKVLCFGNAPLSPESLKVRVGDASILDLLAREIVADLDETTFNETRLRYNFETQYQVFIDELFDRQLIKNESEKIFSTYIARTCSR